MGGILASPVLPNGMPLPGGVTNMDQVESLLDRPKFYYKEEHMRKVLRRFMVFSCLALAPALAPAQTKATFEVASVKPAAPLDMAKLKAAIQNGETPRLGARVDGVRAEYIYVTLQDLFFLAYNVKSSQITGPDWMASQRFDIVAKLPHGASREDVPKMLKALLEDRFKLALHRESKERPALALVIGAGGPKMKRSSESSKPVDAGAPLAPGEKQMDGPDGPIRTTTDKNGGFTMNMGAKGTVSYVVDPATRSMKIEASQLTMGGLADWLTIIWRATGGGLEVKDMTGLTGNYQVAINFSLEDLTGAARAKWTHDPNPPAGVAETVMPSDAAPNPGGSPSLVKAVQSLGLKLEPRKVPVEQLVIDHIEKTPTEN
jgi:uncharacterized protein (TIGR03435 family)